MSLIHSSLKRNSYKLIFITLLLLISVLAQAKQSQLKHMTSQYSFDDTINKLKSAFNSKGLTIFSIIDHAKAAKSVGIDMPSTQVIIFGNPKIGTPLMLKAPNLAIQLPLRVLVSQHKNQVVVSIFNAEYLAVSVDQPKELTMKLNKVTQLIQKTIE